MIDKSVFLRNLRAQCYAIATVVMPFLFVFVWPSITYGKMQLPVALELDLASSALSGKPVSLEVKVICKIPIDEGQLGLAIPTLNEEPAMKQVLWEGQLDEASTLSETFLLPPLNVGNYQLQAWFTFKPRTEGARLVGVSRNLFIDVRFDKILSSNVSFRHIKRIELKQELEKLNLKALSKDDLKAAYPQLAEEIEKLNLQDAVVNQESASKQGESTEVPVDERGEPIRAPSPPAPGAKQTTEEPIPGHLK